MALSPIIVTTKFNDGDGDGIINLGSANVKKFATQLDGGRVKTIVFQNKNADGKYVYWPVGYTETVVETPTPTPPPAPEPTPTPTPTPTPSPEPVPTVKGKSVITADGELFFANDVLTLGFCQYGNLGTTKNAPAGYVTDVKTGLLRAGMYPYNTTGNDILLQGRCVEGYSLAYKIGSNVYSRCSALLTGYTQVKGKMTIENGAPVFRGATDEKVAVTEVNDIDGLTIRKTITIKNNGSVALANLRYQRLFDADQSDKYDTVNIVLSNQEATAKMANGWVMRFKTADTRSFFAFNIAVPPIVDASKLVAAPVGTKKTGDNSVHMAFDIGTLAAGAETTIVLEYILTL